MRTTPPLLFPAAVGVLLLVLLAGHAGAEGLPALVGGARLPPTPTHPRLGPAMKSLDDTPAPNQRRSQWIPVAGIIAGQERLGRRALPVATAITFGVPTAIVHTVRRLRH